MLPVVTMLAKGLGELLVLADNDDNHRIRVRKAQQDPTVRRTNYFGAREAMIAMFLEKMMQWHQVIVSNCGTLLRSVGRTEYFTHVLLIEESADIHQMKQDLTYQS